MFDLSYLVYSWAFSIVIGFFLGQCAFWLKKNFKQNKEVSLKISNYHSEVTKGMNEMSTRIVILETRLNERNVPKSFGPNNFILPESPKKKAGRPPKKVEIKNP